MYQATRQRDLSTAAKQLCLAVLLVAAPAAFGAADFAVVSTFSRLVGVATAEAAGRPPVEIELYYRRGENSRLPYLMMSPYDLVILPEQSATGDFTVITPGLNAVQGHLAGQPLNNSWDALTLLANFPLSQSVQPLAIDKYRRSESQAVKTAILLALRASALTTATSDFLATQLYDTNLSIRTAALLAMQPVSIYRQGGSKSQYVVDGVLTAFEHMLDTGVQPAIFALLMSVLGEEPFISSKRTASLAARFKPISSDSALENEMLRYYQAKIRRRYP